MGITSGKNHDVLLPQRRNFEYFLNEEKYVLLLLSLRLSKMHFFLSFPSSTIPGDLDYQPHPISSQPWVSLGLNEDIPNFGLKCRAKNKMKKKGILRPANPVANCSSSLSPQRRATKPVAHIQDRYTAVRFRSRGQYLGTRTYESHYCTEPLSRSHSCLH